jgi:hypothetical protein
MLDETPVVNTTQNLNFRVGLTFLHFAWLATSTNFDSEEQHLRWSEALFGYYR